jgi:peptide/nickel transport system permease protein
MVRYLTRRLAFAAFLVFTVSSASMLLTHLAPGDYATEVLGVGSSEAERAELRKRAGLDRSITEQYLDWLARAARFDFGRSLAYDRPVIDLIPQRAAYTAILAIAALLVATAVGLPLGVLTASHRGLFPAMVRGTSVLLVSMPPLLTSLLLVFVAARTGWVPVGGVGGAGSPAASGVAPDVLELAHHMVVPVLALALPLTAMFERLQAQAMQDEIGRPYVLATLARGVPAWRVTWRDALRPALKPVASIYGLVAGTLLSGSFAVEVVTAWPGLGRLTLDALRSRDVYLVAGCGAAASMFLAVGALLSDTALVVIDPRTGES